MLIENGAVPATMLMYEIDVSQEGLRKILKTLEENGYVVLTPHGGKWTQRKVLAGVKLLPYMGTEAHGRLIIRGIDEALRQLEIQHYYANRIKAQELANMIHETYRLLRHILGVAKLVLEQD
jgi:DNA-binding IclR family transcriptional regulator